MINNVRLWALKTKNNLYSSKIKIEPSHFDPKFITEYKKSIDTFSEGR